MFLVGGVLLILGLIVGGILGTILIGDPAYMIVWAVGAPVLVLFIVITVSVRSKRNSAGMALARVDAARLRGSGSDGEDLAEFDLTVVPDAIAPYRTTTRATLPSGRFDLYPIGTIVVVTRLRADGPEVSLEQRPPVEWQTKAARARVTPDVIPPVASVRSWAGASLPTVEPPVARRPRLAGAIIAGVAVVAVIGGLTLFPAWTSIGRAVAGAVEGDWGVNNLVTGRYQHDAIAGIASDAGHWNFTSINFYDDSVIVKALTTEGAETTDEWHWRYGRALHIGPELIQPQNVDEVVFDASDLNFSAVSTAVDDAVERARLDDLDATYAAVRRTAADPEPTISVSLSNAYFTANFRYAFDGELLDQSGTAPALQ